MATSPRRGVGTPPRRPRVLTVAGSDSSGGAGIQADLKTFQAHGAYGMSAITAITAQNPEEVRAVLELPAELVREQMLAVLEDVGADAIKIGMLGSPALIDAVCSVLENYRSVPLVVDPVMVSSSGHSLLPDESVARLIERLLPLADLLTPNLPEAAVLTGRELPEPLTILPWMLSLPDSWGCSVLLKGGHGRGAVVTDYLLLKGGTSTSYEHPRIASSPERRSGHGTGCTLASAVAARLAYGETAEDAARAGIRYVARALEASQRLEPDLGALDHLSGLEEEQQERLLRHPSC